MKPVEFDDTPPAVENIGPADVADAAFDFLDSRKPAAPAPKPAAPQPVADEADPLAPPAPAAKPKPAPKPADPPADADPLSPEALAAAAPKKDDGMPADLLKDDEINKLPEKKQREAFTKERAAHRESRQKNQEFAARIQELQSKAQDAEQVAELRQKLEAREAEYKKLEADVARMDLTRSPEFRKRYDDRLNGIGQRMVKTLVDEGVRAEEATKLVRSLVAEPKPSAREYALDASAPSLKGTLLAFLTQFDEVSQERAVALEKARETAAAIDEAESRGRLAAMAGRVDAVADKAVADAAAMGSPYYKEVQGNDQWNADVAARKQTLKGLLLSSDPEKLAPYVADGLTAADTRRRYSELYARFKALESEHAQVIGSSPRLGRTLPGQEPPPPAPRRHDTGGMGLEDIIEGALAP